MRDWLEIQLGLSRWQWFRRWRGGRWELHLIDICHSAIWLHMSDNPARQWPAYRQPCSVGAPLIEDWPIRTKGSRA